MSEKTSSATLSVAELFAERDARRRRDREAEDQLLRRRDEELADYRQRLDNFQLTDAVIQSGLARIKHAFELGESEMLLAFFPSSFCTDDGRTINNAGAPPINKPSKEELAARPDEPEWLETVPRGVRKVYDYWKDNLRPGASSLPLASSIIPAESRAMSACSPPGRQKIWTSDPNSSVKLESVA